MVRKLLLIDGDQFVFTATVAIEKETRWDEHNHVLYSNPDEAFANLDGMLKRIFERFETDDHALTFSSPNNFRKDVWPDYKLNRKSVRKPLCYSAVRELADQHYNTLVMDGLEADDIMGILATKPGGAQRIIVSQDKDMRTIPALTWNGKELYGQSTFEADRFHLYQTLIGDNADGFRGCPGVGPVKAEKLLTYSTEEANHDTANAWWWSQVVKAYAKAGLTEADALQQARLARILRWTDWDSDAKKPILWEPK
jgi:5'-3' exonuclease